MSLKISHRSPVVWNCIFFCLSSFLFLYLQKVSTNFSSILNSALLKTFVSSNLVYIALLICSTLSFYKLKKVSKLLFILLTAFTLVLSVFFLWESFSKVVLVLLFLYLISSVYLYQFLEIELNESFYNALYSKNDLKQENAVKLRVSLKQKDKTVAGELTNWSSEGFFTRLVEESAIKTGQVSGEVEYANKKFYFEGRIVAKLHKNGFGVKIKHIKYEDAFNWDSLIQILNDKGYIPRMII